jgi:hypothetical protein
MYFQTSSLSLSSLFIAWYILNYSLAHVLHSFPLIAYVVIVRLRFSLQYMESILQVRSKYFSSRYS